MNTIRSLALLDDIPPRSHATGILDQLVEQLIVFDAEVREVVEFASEQIHGRTRGDKPVKFKSWSAWPPCCQHASGLLEPHIQEFAPESRDEGRRAQAGTSFVCPCSRGASGPSRCSCRHRTISKHTAIGSDGRDHYCLLRSLSPLKGCKGMKHHAVAHRGKPARNLTSPFARASVMTNSAFVRTKQGQPVERRASQLSPTMLVLSLASSNDRGGENSR